MARTKKTARPAGRNAAYGQAFARLDTALAKNSRSNDIEKINMMRIALFGDAALEVIRQEQSGTVKIPE
jgi:2-phosphoglycerate kinase